MWKVDKTMQCMLEADATCLIRQITLPPQAESAGAARSAVRRTLDYWGLGEVTEDAVLLASELVGNAVCHARHGLDGADGVPAVVLSLTYARSGLRIEVRDTDPRPPQPRVPQHRAPGSLDESGFGFVLVDALARCWGVSRSDPGKAVWAELAVSPPPG